MMIPSKISVLSREEGKVRSELNRELDISEKKRTLIFSKEKGTVSIVYLNPLSVHGR